MGSAITQAAGRWAVPLMIRKTGPAAVIATATAVQPVNGSRRQRRVDELLLRVQNGSTIVRKEIVVQQ